LKLLVTGASGFVGSALLFRLSLDAQHQVKAALRHEVSNIPENVMPVQVGDLGPETDWQLAVSGANAIIHTAARVHVMSDKVDDPLAEYRRVNVEGTLHLARQAAAAGVGRFIFISSIKVNGEGTLLGRPYTADDKPAPVEPYGVSKREAEDGLRQLAAATGMEVVILRPPLVYGPGVRGNFLRLLSLVDRGFPLPLRLVDNRRSMIYLGNLIDAINLCISHPKAAGRTFLVSDCEDVSTPELIRRLAEVLDRPVRLLPFPQTLVRFVGKLFGKSVEVDRLLDSLVIDSSKIRNELDWKPRYTMTQGLEETAAWYRRKVNSV